MLLLLTILITLTNLLHALKDANSSFLWRINTIPVSYMFGTVHVPYTDVWDDIPDNAKDAFDYSTHLYLELDLTSPEVLAELNTCRLLPDNKSIAEVVPTDVFLTLERHMDYVRKSMDEWVSAEQKKQGLTGEALFDGLLGDWEHMRPIWVMVLITMNIKSFIATVEVPFLDQFLSEVAKAQKKHLGGLESAGEQCNPLNNIALPQVIFGLNQTLHYLDNVRTGLETTSQIDVVMEEIVSNYRKGNLSYSFGGVPTLPMKEIMLSPEEAKLESSLDEELRIKFVEGRSKRMGERIVEILKEKKAAYFFAAGVGHFTGKDRIQDVVEAAGFRVDHVGPNEKLDLPSCAHHATSRYLILSVILASFLINMC